MSYYDYDEIEVSALIGKTLSAVKKQGDDELHFTTTDGEKFVMYHSQSCCESVEIESIVGDLQDLVGTPIVKAEEATSDKRPAGVPEPDYEPDSQTWTFYKFATIKGYVDIRWFGRSNGWYSERVTFAKVIREPQA